MGDAGRLQVAFGFASALGRRPDNQDFGAIDVGTARERDLQGVVAAIADGAGGGNGGRIASELAVRSFLDGYRGQDTLRGIGAAAMNALDAYNRWLHAQSLSAPSLRGAATTFTALVLRGRAATVLHVGDSRAWRLRSDDLALLTEDNVAMQPDGGQRLLRALGLESSLRLDVQSRRIEAHDRFLLSTDGVHAVLGRGALVKLLGRRQAPQADADAIVAAALNAGGHDNASALVLDVMSVPTAEQGVIEAELQGLPVLAPPVPGHSIDGFQVTRVIAEGKTTRLLLALEGDDPVVLKFPKPEGLTKGDSDRFMREVFVGQRISHAFVGASLSLAEGRQTQLYVAMPYYQGETLEARLAQGPLAVNEVISISCKVGRGLVALHRAGLAHRDIKPQNIMLLDDGGLKIIDLGVARLRRIDAAEEEETPGTIDYMAPELFGQERGDASSDQYAMGVTMYRMLSGRYPYGQTAPGTRPLFGPVPPLARARPDVPAWLDAAVQRSLSMRPEERFADIDELIFELENGASRAAPLARALPLHKRYPHLPWQILSAILAMLLLFTLLRR